MSDAKHTPGPWVILLDDDAIEIVGNADERSVPVADIMLDEHTSFAPQMIEAVANANLIAAAPDLLEALENLLAVHEGQGGTKYHAGDIARAAIAKAKGF